MIIGITGTLGAGKGTVAHMLVQKGLKYESVRNFLVELLQKENQQINRDTMHEIANRLRKNFGSDFIVAQIIQKINLQQLQEQYDSERKSIPNQPHIPKLQSQIPQSVIIESIRSLGEVKKLKEMGGILLAVDAPVQIRYDRIKKRASATDNVSFEKFVTDELSEDNNTEHEQNLPKCIGEADFVIINDGDLPKLHAQVDEFIATYKIGI
jgi:dephospho-CoA kinase